MSNQTILIQVVLVKFTRLLCIVCNGSMHCRALTSHCVCTLAEQVSIHESHINFCIYICMIFTLLILEPKDMPS